jgi:hypothetical protein
MSNPGYCLKILCKKKNRNQIDPTNLVNYSEVLILVQRKNIVLHT